MNQERSTAVYEQLMTEMQQYFGDDRARIEHAMRVLDFAEQILKSEAASELVVRAAAILHDIGIPEAERTYGSAAGKYQEELGPPIAEGILRDVGLDEETVTHVCRIIANHHSARDIDTPEFHIIWDADWLVNMPGTHPDLSSQKRSGLIDRIFKTETGRRIAREQFLPGV